MTVKRDSASFAFGENWSSYSTSVTDRHLAVAKDALVALLPELPAAGAEGATFVDLGCGSGLHSVAAATMGLAVTSVDIDPVCVETTKVLAQRFGVEDRIRTFVGSALDANFMKSLDRSRFVYSWGVLHHTGDLWSAVSNALELATEGPDARVVIALYQRTLMCPVWKVEKRWYSAAGSRGQHAADTIYSAARNVASWVRRTPPPDADEYWRNRGMSLEHDVRDWLGGYPYESTTREDFAEFARQRGWESTCLTGPMTGRALLGLFGSTCDEFVLRRLP